ncbi:MAG: hypothetical protein Salg2KO_21540 [Salibacteraceae bacterium]
MRLCTKNAFVRFVGNGLQTNDYKRIDDWINRIQTWQSLGLERLWFFVHQHDALDSPALIEYMTNKLNQIENVKVKAPQFGRLF